MTVDSSVPPVTQDVLPAGRGVGRSGVPPTLVHPNDLAGHSPLPSSSVGPETPDTPLPAAFRHSGWERQRAAVFHALSEAGVKSSRLRRFGRCGSGFWIMQGIDDPSLFRLCVDFCRDRWCVPCQRARAAVISANLADHLDERPYRLITLTLRHRTEPLNVTLDRLYDSFKRLRRSKGWKQRVTGGCAFVEVVLSKTDSLWHAHVHVICEGQYYAHSALSDDWHQATGDSFVVDIRLVRNTDHVTRYVTKYATKPTNLDPVGQSDYLLQLITALNHRRVIVPFGTWTRWRLLSSPTEHGWKRYCHSSDLGLSNKRDAWIDDAIAATLLLAFEDRTMREFQIPELSRSPPDPTKDLKRRLKVANDARQPLLPNATPTQSHYA